MASRNRVKDTTFWNILSYLHDRVDPETRTYQVDIDTFAHAVGIHKRTLYRHLSEMKRLHLIASRRVKTDFVGGQQPNVYTLLVDPEQIRKMWEPYVTGPLREQPDPIATDPEIPDHVLPVEDAVSDAIAETLADLEVTDELEADAWLAGMD